MAIETSCLPRTGLCALGPGAALRSFASGARHAVVPIVFFLLFLNGIFLFMLLQSSLLLTCTSFFSWKGINEGNVKVLAFHMYTEF